MIRVADTLLSIGGEPLLGENRALDIYIDEAGTDAKERFVTVAAVMINPYRQLREVRSHIEQAITDVVPADVREGFYFHAKDVMRHRGLSVPEKNNIVVAWLKIARQCALPVALAYAAKQEIDQERTLKKGFDIWSDWKLPYATGMLRCLTMLNGFIKVAHPDDFSSIFVEKNDAREEGLRFMFRSVLNNPDAPPYMREYGLDHIQNGLNFCAKQDSFAMQIADAFAYAFHRYVSKRPGGDLFISTMRGSPEFFVGQDLRSAPGGSTLFIDPSHLTDEQIDALTGVDGV